MSSVSIIIPIYNVEKYVSECLCSVIAQTYSGPMECILVDDCGGDRSMDIVNDIISSYNGEIKFHILHHKNNRGLSAARNTGIMSAIGEYLLFLDSDDKLLPNSIETLVAIVNKYPHIDMVVGGILTNGRASVYDISKRPSLIKDYYSDRRYVRKLLLEGVTFPVMAWNKLINSSFLKTNNLYFKEGIIHEDIHWNFFVQRYVNDVAISQKPTYVYRINPDGIVERSKHNRNSENSYKIIIDDIYKTIFNSMELSLYELSYLIRYICVYLDLAGNESIDEITRGDKLLKKIVLCKRYHGGGLKNLYNKLYGRFLLYRLYFSTIYRVANN